ncbi:hypothetical protein NBRC111894_1572 [Sporolactobacillus inulinus]|uniref:Uncharacterized protein n=1 Tax=Sporolactobacillus inulinus TaxID=2078 RepID=A0A4Y1ZB96_9BACL|nr:hypothetical protein NBRC111894_1572 [Sporolactobacillus inulinus]
MRETQPPKTAFALKGFNHFAHHNRRYCNGSHDHWCAFILGLLAFLILLGIHYDDFNTLFMFTIFYCAFSLIGEVVLKGFIYVVHYFKVKKWQIKWIFLFLTAFFINIAIISSLDDQLTGIFIHPETKFIVSLFLAALDLAMEWDKI